MKQGLIIGKFMPLHTGHMALFEHALMHCDHLTIEVCARYDEPIPGEQRLQWVWEAVRFLKHVTVTYNTLLLPDAPYSSRTVSEVWARYLTKRYPGIDIIFTSEHYGNYLAEFMQIEHGLFDIQRSNFPVSASMIREFPYAHWDFIPDHIKPYFTKSFCLYGPESTGKSTLAKDLAGHYNSSLVPETARLILEGLDDLRYEHIERIGIRHAREILAKKKAPKPFLFVDTDILTTLIYSNYYFKKVPKFAPWIFEVNSYDHYFFLDIDTPWIPDPHRDLGKNREEMKELFLHELATRDIDYTLVQGGWQERFNQVCQVIDRIRNEEYSYEKPVFSYTEDADDVEEIEELEELDELTEPEEL